MGESSAAECTEIYDPASVEDNDEWIAADEHFRTNTSYLDQDGPPLPTGSMISYRTGSLSKTLMIFQTVRQGNHLISSNGTTTFLQDLTTKEELLAQGMGPEQAQEYLETRNDVLLQIPIQGNRLVGVSKI